MKWHYEIIIGFCVLDFTLKCVHLNWMSKSYCDLLLLKLYLHFFQFFVCDNKRNRFCINSPIHSNDVSFGCKRVWKSHKFVNILMINRQSYKC